MMYRGYRQLGYFRERERLVFFIVQLLLQSVKVNTCKFIWFIKQYFRNRMKIKDGKNKKILLVLCHFQIPDVLKRSQYPTNTAVLTREGIHTGQVIYSKLMLTNLLHISPTVRLKIAGPLAFSVRRRSPSVKVPIK